MIAHLPTSSSGSPAEQPEPVCTFLEFDTSLFGVRIGRVLDGPLTPAKAGQAIEWAYANSIGCLYYLAPLSDTGSIAIAQRNGFDFADVRMTYVFARPDRLPANREEPPAGEEGERRTVLRAFRSSDIDALQSIASTSFTDTRFYQDPRFDRQACRRLYEIWVDKSCHGWADAVIVAELDDRPVGFVTCHATVAGEGSIGLVGVSEYARGQGVGQALIQGALKWMAEREVARISVVTQGRNLAAQRLYQRSGLLVDQIHLWLHWWSDGTGRVG